jgi:chromosome segregation ATPase
MRGFIKFITSTKFMCWSVLCVLLLVIVCQCCRAEGSYQLTEPELSNIKHYISVIKQEKQQLLNDLQTCKISLKQAEEQRQSLENQLNEALTNCKLLQEERNELETLSKDLKEQFDQSKKEAESKIRKLTIQRNIFVAVSLILGALAL